MTHEHESIKQEPVKNVLPVRVMVDRNPVVQVVPIQLQLVLSVQVSIGPVTVSCR